VIRIVDGPHLDRFADGAIDALCDREWVVTDAADRTGLRLDGGAITYGEHGAEVSSVGLPPGAMQVPPDGRPIVMLADRPATGGYAVLACVAQADLGYPAQLAPGDAIRFDAITHDAAVEALRRRWSELDALEPVDPDGRDPAWAGALD
jgi:allophanate hydrolase subunit 2